MAITVNFDIPMPNEPYVDDFSDGNTHPGVYKGPRYLKVERRDSDGLFGAVIADGDTQAELDNGITTREGYNAHILDAQVNPLQASYLTGYYTNGDVADYTEDLGTTDADGNPETWTYYWNDGTGIIGQIYLRDTLKFANGNYVGPDFRAHALTRDSFLQTFPNQKAHLQSEIDSGNHDEAKVTELQEYLTWLDSIETKYANVKHWKIPFKPFPVIS